MGRAAKFRILMLALLVLAVVTLFAPAASACLWGSPFGCYTPNITATNSL